MSLYIVTKAGCPRDIVGIPHARAVNGIIGPAVFGFRDFSPAVKVARVIDSHMRAESSMLQMEDALFPVSNLVVGKTIKTNIPQDPIRTIFDGESTNAFDGIDVCKVEEDLLLQYITALQGSVIILADYKEHLNVCEILSPLRSVYLTSEYLEHLYKMK